MKPQKWIVYDARHGVCLHVLHDEKEAQRFGRHHERETGDRPALLGWAPGELEVLDQGAVA